MQTLDEIKQEFMHHIFLKAVEEIETIIGSARLCLEQETAYIERLMVKPEFENRGIGTILMKSTEKYFVSLNGTNCLQDTGVAEIYIYIKNLVIKNSDECLRVIRLRWYLWKDIDRLNSKSYN